MFKKVKENKKGFTLAELLIVVAIIAVLVAISIPIFTSQLEKSREAVDLANIRSAYAEVAAEALSNDTSDYSETVVLKQSDLKSWVIDSTSEVAGIPIASLNLSNVTDKKVEIKYTASSKKITINGVEAKTSFKTSSTTPTPTNPS